MFDTIEKDKKYQCSSEFGLYKYDSENDYYIRKTKTKFGFYYFVILISSIIILLGICVLTYNYTYKSTRTPKYIINSTELSLITVNDTGTNLNMASYPEPIALEFKNSKRKSDDPRPFLYEIRDPKPMGFQYSTSGDHNYQAAQNINSQRTRGKNIQEIIKLLEQSQDDISNNKKFKKPVKKPASFVQDPFFPYKPQNPSDINLLATNRFRFAPTVQIEVKKPPKNDQYPKYEKPLTQQEMSQTLDVQNNKRQNKLKNLYNQNTYFNDPNRFHQNRIKSHWIRPEWTPQRDQKNKNNFVPPPMIVHLNLYPKKKRKQNDQYISESNLQKNCTDWDDDNYQIKNASEFNHLLEIVRHSFLNHSNDKVTINDYDKVNEFKYLPTDNPYINEPDVEIQKSIGFTIVNSNFSSSNLQNRESQWRPMIYTQEQDNISNQDDILEVGEASESSEYDNEDSGEAVTLPLPYDIFQKYFNSKPTKPYKHDWNWETVKKNPNIVNHKPVYENGRDE